MQRTHATIVAEMRDILLLIDSTSSGSISHAELMSVLEYPTVRSCFGSIGLDSHDVERLYALIDETDSGEIKIVDLLEALMRLKGEARSIDVHAVWQEAKKIKALIADQDKHLQGQLIQIYTHHLIQFHNQNLVFY